MPETPVDYLDVDEFGPYTVRCMSGCGQIIAKRKTFTTSRGEQYLLIHNVTSGRYPVKIADGSKANLLVCKKCIKNNNIDLPKLEATMHEGWRKTQDARYKNKSTNDYDAAMQRVTDMKNLKTIEV